MKTLDEPYDLPLRQSARLLSMLEELPLSPHFSHVGRADRKRLRGGFLVSLKHSRSGQPLSMLARRGRAPTVHSWRSASGPYPAMARMLERKPTCCGACDELVMRCWCGRWLSSSIPVVIPVAVTVAIAIAIAVAGLVVGDIGSQA